MSGFLKNFDCGRSAFKNVNHWQKIKLLLHRKDADADANANMDEDDDNKILLKLVNADGRRSSAFSTGRQTEAALVTKKNRRDDRSKKRSYKIYVSGYSTTCLSEGHEPQFRQNCRQSIGFRLAFSWIVFVSLSHIWSGVQISTK